MYNTLLSFNFVCDVDFKHFECWFYILINRLYLALGFALLEILRKWVLFCLVYYFFNRLCFFAEAKHCRILSHFVAFFFSMRML